MTAVNGAAISLTMNYFQTESCCDKLQVQGSYYSGSNPGGLDGRRMNSGEVMYWMTDGSVTTRGWQICANAVVPPHPTGIPGAYSINSGPCHINSDGSCFYSPNYPSGYGNSQDCNIRVNLPTGLDVVAFNSENGYDKLTVHGAYYQNTGAGLQGIAMQPGETMQWHTDGSVTRTGFAICSGILSTNSPTTVSPTVSPTTYSPTVSPTTVSPTTVSPTTSPTTVSPTTSPTTVSPTVSPTTVAHRRGTDVGGGGGVVVWRLMSVMLTRGCSVACMWVRHGELWGMPLRSHFQQLRRRTKEECRPKEKTHCN